MPPILLPHNIYIVLRQLGIFRLPLIVTSKVRIPAKLRISNRADHIVAIEDKPLRIFDDRGLVSQRK